MCVFVFLLMTVFCEQSNKMRGNPPKHVAAKIRIGLGFRSSSLCQGNGQSVQREENL